MPSLVLSLTPLPVSHLVILTVGRVTLEVTNGFIYGTIHPPRPKIAPAGDKYEQIFKNHRMYSVSIRKLSEQKV